jgi:hypothetical protein
VPEEDRHDRDVPETHNIEPCARWSWTEQPDAVAERNIYPRHRAEKRIEMITEGDVVDRHWWSFRTLQSPASLHRMSMMAHKVRMS